MSDKGHEIVKRADVVPQHAALHPLVAEIMAKNPTPEALEKVCALQTQWEANEARRAFNDALVQLKGELPPFLTRDKVVHYKSERTGNTTHYTHTSLAAAMETVTPLLSKYGFSLTWKSGMTAQGSVTVTAILTHRLGHFSENTLAAPPESGGQKSAPQAVASTVTLLQRYTALSLLGLATADMEEPQNATDGDTKTETQAKPEDKVDTQKNLRAVAELSKRGKSKDEAEKYVGKAAPAWTEGDLAKLRAWVKPPSAPASPPKLASEAQLKDLIKAAAANGWEQFQVKAKLDEMGFDKGFPLAAYEATLQFFKEVGPTGKVSEQSELPI